MGAEGRRIRRSSLTDKQISDIDRGLDGLGKIWGFDLTPPKELPDEDVIKRIGLEAA
jgi:hypothetical protein